MAVGPNVSATHDEGTPYRPTAFECAELLRSWGPRSAENLDIPPSKDRSLVSWTCTSGKNNRIDMTAWSGWRQRRVFGQIASISETTSGNSDTPYRFDVVSKLPYCADCHLNQLPNSNLTDASCLSWLWVQTTAYSSSALVPPGAVIRLGTFAQCIVSAKYNGTNKATLESWSLVDWDDWETPAGATMIAQNEVGLFRTSRNFSYYVAQPPFLIRNR